MSGIGRDKSSPNGSCAPECPVPARHHWKMIPLCVAQYCDWSIRSQAPTAGPAASGAADTRVLPNTPLFASFPLQDELRLAIQSFFNNRYAGKADAMDKIVLLCALIGILLLASELSVVAKPGPNKP